MLSYFSTYSSLELRHFSHRETNFCNLCRRSLPLGIGTTVTLISASLSFRKHRRWPDRNLLRCKKIWKSLGMRSGLQGGQWVNPSQPNSCRRCVECRAVCLCVCVCVCVCGHKPSTADNEFWSVLFSVHLKLYYWPHFTGCIPYATYMYHKLYDSGSEIVRPAMGGSPGELIEESVT